MFDQAISYAKEHNISIIQLTTNKKRTSAKHFYEKLGFEASHEGMKLYKAQEKWFKELMEDKNYVMFTAIEDCHPRENGDPVLDSRLRGNDIIGFVIGKLMPAPEVYNPGGLTAMIDDFCVKSENLWQSVGAKLIKDIKAAAKDKGATQTLVVCGAHDHRKRKFLRQQNLSIASEWFVGGIV